VTDVGVPLPVESPAKRSGWIRRRLGRLGENQLLNKVALKALKGADDIMGSIPILPVMAISELKDVCITAMED
jgi:hypothetical protein